MDLSLFYYKSVKQILPALIIQRLAEYSCKIFADVPI